MEFQLHQNCIVFGEYFHAKFPDLILSQDLPIPALELLAITVAIKTWAKKLQGLRLIVHCDNDASVQAINHKRSHNIFMQHSLRELWLYHCITFRYTLSIFQDQLIHLRCRSPEPLALTPKVLLQTDTGHEFS